MHELPGANLMNSTLVADVGHGGHRHLHVRFLFDFIFNKDRESLTRLWFYLPAETARAVTRVLGEEAAAVFSARVIQADSRKNGCSLNGVLAAVREVSARQVLFLDIDRFIYRLTWQPLPVAVSGVWFRPNFHYSSAKFLHEGAWQRAIGILKRGVARVLCARAGIRRLFVFDAAAADYATRQFGTDKVRYLPDPFAFPAQTGPKPLPGRRERIVFAIVGSISRRKGIFSFLAALELLAPEDQLRIELRIVGRTEESETALLTEIITRASESTLAKITYRNEFVSDEAIDLAIVEADVLLLLYRRFIGSSGLMIRAALLGRPVVATRYGLIGAMVNRHCLGLTVDPYDHAGIARAITRVIDGGPLGYDAAAARRFAAMHSPELYVNGLYELIADAVPEVPAIGLVAAVDSQAALAPAGAPAQSLSGYVRAEGSRHG